jgi:arginyl-tRNA synthetase
MQEFTDKIRAALRARAGLPEPDIKLEQPRDPKLGDFAFPCFPLAKALKKAPPAIAAELAGALDADLDGITAEASGPYINFRVEPALLAETVVGAALEAGTSYGSSQEGAGKKIVIDLSSPNIAKPMSVGHLRSTVIGGALQRIFDTLGYETVGINHIGDWGSQFGKLIAALDRWGAEMDLESDPIRALLALYVRYHEEEESDPELAEAGRAAFRALEGGEDKEVRKKWEHITALSLVEFDKIYERLGVSFDEVRGEAFYETYLESAVERVEAAGITEMSEGAMIVDLSHISDNTPPCLLRKTDGTTLYATRDLAAVFHRWELYDFTRCLYVVGGDQRLHFQQLKGVLQRMELAWEERVEHIAFGMMRLPEGKMSTRKGRVVFLEDVLDRAVEEALRIVGEKNPDLAGAEEIAEKVGVGAVVFNDLRRERIKDVEFDWDEILSFEGETGPYVQYTHARLASIQRKAADRGEGGGAPDWSALEDARGVLLRIGRFPDVIRSAARNAEPSEVTTWLLGLSREVNGWYAAHRVLGQDSGVTAARLALVRASQLAIAAGLKLLGIAAPEEM